MKTKTIFWYIFGALIGSHILWAIGYSIDDVILNQFPDLDYDDATLNFFNSTDSSTESLERTNEMNLYRLSNWVLVVFFHMPVIYLFSRALKSEFNKRMQSDAAEPRR